jgi:hypothetical protein
MTTGWSKIGFVRLHILLTGYNQVQGVSVQRDSILIVFFSILFKLSATCFGRTTTFKWKCIISDIYLSC